MRVRACAGLLAASWLLLSPFAFAGGQATGGGDEVPVLVAPLPDPARLDLASVEPERLAKVDRMLAATGFGATYDQIFAMFRKRPLPADAAPELVEERRVKERMIALISWQSTSDLWRAAFAQMLPDDVLGSVSTFHESDAGRAIAACMAKATDMLAMNGCWMSVDSNHLDASSEFLPSPANRAYEDVGARMMEPIMRFSLRRALERSPEDAAALASMCQRKPGDMLCAMLSAADPAR
jgi:hypothetical protein